MAFDINVFRADAEDVLTPVDNPNFITHGRQRLYVRFHYTQDTETGVVGWQFVYGINRHDKLTEYLRWVLYKPKYDVDGITRLPIAFSDQDYELSAGILAAPLPMFDGLLGVIDNPNYVPPDPGQPEDPENPFMLPVTATDQEVRLALLKMMLIFVDRLDIIELLGS